MQRVIVVVGAGASFDCANEAATFHPDYRPPLAQELFRAATRPSFQAVLRQYPGAMALAPDLAELSLESAFSIEKELSCLASHPNARVREQFLDIPRYLSSLLARVSETYTENPGNYVRLIKRLVADSGHRVTLVSLNYDTLLERGLSIFAPEYTWTHIDNYVDDRRGVTIVKPHGSCNWFVATTENHEVKVAGGTAVTSYRLPPRPWDIVIERHDELPMSEKVYPVLTAPLASKGDEHIVCPIKHVAFVEGASAEATKMLFVGTSALDTHVLQCIGKHANKVSLVHVVGKGDLGDCLDRIRSALVSVKPEVISGYQEGFRKYLSSTEFAVFAAA